jgi:hypothetical protein
MKQENSEMNLNGHSTLVRRAMTRTASIAVVIFAIAIFSSIANAANFHVTTTADNGNNTTPTAGSLRKAIIDANAHAGLDTIDFNIAGVGVQTISPPAPLPIISDPVVIDGYTQRPCASNPAPCSQVNSLANGDNAVLLIELNGINLGQGSGLWLDAGGSTIKGLVIHHFGDAILVIHNGGNVITGNFLGLDPTGTVLAGNSVGVDIVDSGGNIIGGTTPASRNLISGNGSSGVSIQGAAAANNLVQGNFVGPDRTGSKLLVFASTGIALGALGATQLGTQIGGTLAGAGNVIAGFASGISVNGEMGNVLIQGNLIGTDATGKIALGNLYGVFIQASTNQAATVGGASPSARNIISGNTYDGIVLTQQNSGVVIKGNYIGTDISGNVALGNGQDGIESYVPNLVVGGPGAGEGNVISSNGRAGITLNSAPSFTATGNLIRGNLIGYAANGITALGNAGDGVQVLGANNNTIGSSGAGNSIANNGGAGVHIASGSGNLISSNKITSNKALGIDLDPAGVNLNDLADGDQGPNNLQNFPAIGSAVTNGANITITGTLISAPNTKFHLEFFASSLSDASGYGQGGTPIGSIDVTTDVSGYTDFTATAVSAGQYISATATDPAGNTSEFSVCAKLDAAPPEVSINDVSVLEGNSGAANAVFTATLKHPYSLPVTLNYFTVDGTATTINDYIAKAGTLTFAPGQTTQNIVIGINSDSQVESDENFDVRLTNPANALINKGTGVCTILNDDVKPVGNLAFSSGSYSINENGGQALITVARSGGSNGAVSIKYSTSNGTAVAGSDYTPANGTLNWADGDTASKTFNVAIINNQQDGPDKSVNLTLSNPSGGASLGSPASALLTIVDDDPAPKVSIDDVTQAEGNNGTTNFTFTVSLDAASGQQVSVNYTTADNTAQAGSDYQAANALVTFAPGETSKQVTVVVNGDTQVESNETFVVNLYNLNNAAVGKVTGVGTIVNDDSNSSSPAIQFSQATYSVQEDLGSITVTVTRSGDTSGAASVDYTTTDGSAAQKTDFEYAAGSLTFAPGETSKTITVLVNEDTYNESSETFAVTLKNPSGAAIGAQGVALVTITDDLPESIGNPIDDAQSFVYMHYHDFLNREPDAAGLAFWTSQITACGSDTACIDAARANVSAAFYQSIEFQQTGYLLYLVQKESFGTMPKYASFMRDLQEVSRGVIVNAPGWQQKLADNQQKFAQAWAGRPEFKAAYDGLANDAYVNALYANAGLVPPQAKKDSLVAALNTASMDRAAVLLDVASDATFRQQQMNAAFVLTEYFGYLRRDPDASPDSDLSGYNFWLAKLNQFGGNYINAEMVRSFIVSTEYRQRFGQ